MRACKRMVDPSREMRSLRHMKQLVFPMIVTLALSGCGGAGMFNFGGAEPELDTGPVITDAPAGEFAAGAPANPAGEARFLGLSVASLGDAAEPGLWADTPLVTEQEPGRIIGEDGTVVFVTLRPTGGARGSGTRLSLSAMQGLGISLTALPTVTVLSDSPAS